MKYPCSLIQDLLPYTMTGFAAKKATKLLKLICRNVLLVRTTTILFVKQMKSLRLHKMPSWK